MKFTRKANLCAELSKIFAAMYSGLLCYYLNAPLIVWFFWACLQLSAFYSTFWRIRAVAAGEHLIIEGLKPATKTGGENEKQ